VGPRTTFADTEILINCQHLDWLPLRRDGRLDTYGSGYLAIAKGYFGCKQGRGWQLQVLVFVIVSEGSPGEQVGLAYHVNLRS
jgi:hypothetical protein